LKDLKSWVYIYIYIIAVKTENQLYANKSQTNTTLSNANSWTAITSLRETVVCTYCPYHSNHVLILNIKT